jgi:rubrerythrin
LYGFNGKEGMMLKWSLGNAAVEDLFEMASVVEQGGYDFYERLRARSASPRVKRELEFLRDEEAAHKDFFLHQLSARGKSPGGTIAPGLQEILEEAFIRPLQERFSSGGINDNFRTLGFGLELEKKSIDFYKEMRLAVEESQKADIDRIIAEEEGHLKKLTLMRSYY